MVLTLKTTPYFECMHEEIVRQKVIAEQMRNSEQWRCEITKGSPSGASGIKPVTDNTTRIKEGEDGNTFSENGCEVLYVSNVMQILK